MKIGVFDSGVGGLSVAKAIRVALPEHIVIYKNDRKNVPYGTKTPDTLFGLITPIFDEFVEEGCDVIVIACNTVSTTLIDRLRERYTVPLIGLEPMVKPASKMTKSGMFVVCATPTTLSSRRYQELKETYASDMTIIEPDCSNWAALIEENLMNEAEIRKAIEPAVKRGADVIVLGCTHYHWIDSEIQKVAGNRAAVIHPEAAVIRRLKTILGSIAG